MSGTLIELTKETIDKIFDEAEDQSEYTINLYKIAFPDWDNIAKLDGWPKISDATSLYIFRKAIEFDKCYANVLAGGSWMNSGFSKCDNENVPDWYIDISEVKVSYYGNKEEEAKT